MRPSVLSTGRTIARWVCQTSCCAALTVLMSGCAHKPGFDKYVPQPTEARAALAAALTAWQQGSDAIKLEGSNRRVEVMDKSRRPGQQLKSFDILSEVPGDNGRWFEVKLELANPVEEQQLRYMVIGIDPLWVFRQDDYELVAHWDHKMPAAEPTAAGKQAKK